MINKMYQQKLTNYLVVLAVTIIFFCTSEFLIFSEDAHAQKNKSEITLPSLAKEVAKLKNELATMANAMLPIGTIVPYGGPYNDQTISSLKTKGWLFCDGKRLERGEYQDLYDIIGWAFGKPDINSFNLPDLRGRFIRGVDHGTGRDPDASDRIAENKGNSGDKVGSVQDYAIAKHKHDIKGNIEGNTDGNRYNGGKSGNYAQETQDTGKFTLSDGTEADLGKETRPKNIYVNWIIYAGMQQTGK